MKQIIRGFSIGLLTASIILGAIYFMEKNEPTSKSTAETVAALKDEGYFIYRDNMAEKVNNLETEISELEKKEPAAEENNNNQAEDDDTNPSNLETTTITIEPGMAIEEIMNMLTKEAIISDQGDFLDYLEENEISRYIQVGEFQLHKGMDMEEIADIITGEDVN